MFGDIRKTTRKELTQKTPSWVWKEVTSRDKECITTQQTTSVSKDKNFTYDLDDLQPIRPLK